MKNAQLHHRRSQIVIVACLILLCCARSYGQTSYGSISGKVVDSSGALVPGASIHVQCDCKECPNRPCEECCPSGFSATVTSDDEGHFTVEKVPPGVYVVSGSATGFGTAEARGVRVGVGTSSSVTLTFGDDSPDNKKSSSAKGKDETEKQIRLILQVIDDATDKPLKNARVTLRLQCDCKKECPTKPCEECCPTGLVYAATTDELGTVRFNGEAGNYIVDTSYRAYSKEVLVKVKPGETEKVKVEFALKRIDQ